MTHILLGCDVIRSSYYIGHGQTHLKATKRGKCFPWSNLLPTCTSIISMEGQNEGEIKMKLMTPKQPRSTKSNNINMRIRWNRLLSRTKSSSGRHNLQCFFHPPGGTELTALKKVQQRLIHKGLLSLFSASLESPRGDQPPQDTVGVHTSHMCVDWFSEDQDYLFCFQLPSLLELVQDIEWRHSRGNNYHHQGFSSFREWQWAANSIRE